MLLNRAEAEAQTLANSAMRAHVLRAPDIGRSFMQCPGVL
jgi:hypothetical protein